jgi:hypothetical protein
MNVACCTMHCACYTAIRCTLHVVCCLLHDARCRRTSGSTPAPSADYSTSRIWTTRTSLSRVLALRGCRCVRGRRLVAYVRACVAASFGVCACSCVRESLCVRARRKSPGCSVGASGAAEIWIAPCGSTIPRGISQAGLIPSNPLQCPGIRIGWVVASKRNIETLANYSSFGMGGVSHPSQALCLIHILLFTHASCLRRDVPLLRSNIHIPTASERRIYSTRSC